MPLDGRVVLTPHPGEFGKTISNIKDPAFSKAMAGKKKSKIEEQVNLFSKLYNCIVLVKGEEDVVCSVKECVVVKGGNAGMTKGGTGDVLAGLTAALACNNDLWLAATVGSYINKKAGESLFRKVGYYFNSSDLADEIPRVMKELI